jgi:hypothetical protein
MSHDALLRLSAVLVSRSVTNDANGDLVTTEARLGPYSCHAYQSFGTEETGRQATGREDFVVHLPAEVDPSIIDLLEITWPDGGVVNAEVVGPPARRVNARTGVVHHVEARCREVA